MPKYSLTFPRSRGRKRSDLQLDVISDLPIWTVVPAMKKKPKSLSHWMKKCKSKCYWRRSTTQYAHLYGTGFLTVGQLTVDTDPLSKDTMDNLNISHVTVINLKLTIYSAHNHWNLEKHWRDHHLNWLWSRRPVCKQHITHKWRRSILPKPIKVRNVDGTYKEGVEAWRRSVWSTLISMGGL